MKKAILTVLVFASASNAFAERFSASRYGLTPETGYLNAVTEGDPCDLQTDVRITGGGVDINGDVVYSLIHKCDGSKIGWVTRNIEGNQISPDQGLEVAALRFREEQALKNKAARENREEQEKELALKIQREN